MIDYEAAFDAWWNATPAMQGGYREIAKAAYLAGAASRDAEVRELQHQPHENVGRTEYVAPFATTKVGNTLRGKYGNPRQD